MNTPDFRVLGETARGGSRGQRARTAIAGTLVALLLALFVMPVAAFAQGGDPAGAEYGDRVQQVQAGGGDDPGDGLGGRVVDPLPFTGFDVIAMAAVALAVTGLGLALQRAVSRERQGLE
jgi:hypothetical protein